ncbi:hypothetical protein ACFLSZ_01645 [Candidatus Bipolaricaulota bacterium]
MTEGRRLQRYAVLGITVALALVLALLSSCARRYNLEYYEVETLGEVLGDARQAYSAFFDDVTQCLYYLGGYRQEGDSFLNFKDIIKIDVRSLEVTTLETRIPKGCGSNDVMGPGVWDRELRKFYLIGGCEGSSEHPQDNRVAGIYVLDVATETISDTGTSLPAYRIDGGACWDTKRNLAWITGGYGPSTSTAERVTYQRDIFYFDPEEGVCIEADGSLEEASDDGVAVYDSSRDRVYYIGGHSSGRALDCIQEIVVRDDPVEAYGQYAEGYSGRLYLPRALDGATGYYSAMDGCVYILGGGWTTGEDYLAEQTVYRFCPGNGIERVSDYLPSGVRDITGAHDASSSIDCFYLLRYQDGESRRGELLRGQATPLGSPE